MKEQEYTKKICDLVAWDLNEGSALVVRVRDALKSGGIDFREEEVTWHHGDSQDKAGFKDWIIHLTRQHGECPGKMVWFRFFVAPADAETARALADKAIGETE